MITYSGIHIQSTGYPVETSEAVPAPIDLAVQSGRITLFAGSIWLPLITHQFHVAYMVHSRCARQKMDSEAMIATVLWALMHDAHETITGEIPQPFKPDILREEQKRIDVRLKKTYLRGLEDAILTGLIKIVDQNACDTEALVLGLPGYDEAVKNEMKARNDRPLYSDTADQEVFREIISSEWYRNTVLSSNSAVECVANVLDRMKKGLHAAAYQMLREQFKSFQV